jgi:hypothetical protein
MAALARTRNRDSVMTWLGGDMNVSIRAYSAAGPDSVRWLVSLFDPTSMARGETVNFGPVARSGGSAMTDSLVRLATRALWQLDHTPRRANPGAAPGGVPLTDAAQMAIPAPAVVPAPAVKKP